MIKLHKLIATVFGIGYIGKGGGTIAAAVCCIILILIPASDNIYHWHFFITIFISCLGVWSGSIVEASWGKDSNKVVVDEVAGMMVTLLFIPVNIKHVVIGLILFRFFDIVKPLFIKKMELLPKGWGVMGDDILAGIYGNVLLHVIVSYNIL
jgi:phosphatidylglycerophosphatase A